MVCMIRLLWSNSMKHRDRLAHVAKRPRTIFYTPRNTSDAKFDSSITWFLYCVFLFYFIFSFCQVKYGLKISRFNLVLVLFLMCRTYRSIYMYIRMNSYSTNFYDTKFRLSLFHSMKNLCKKKLKSVHSDFFYRVQPCVHLFFIYLILFCIHKVPCSRHGCEYLELYTKFLVSPFYFLCRCGSNLVSSFQHFSMRLTPFSTCR